MKILHVIPSLAAGFGGPSAVVLELCQELVRREQDVTIFTTDADVRGRLKVNLKTPMNIDGVKIVYFPIQFLQNYKFSLPLAKALKEQIHSFDIVHIHSLFQFSTFIASYYCQRSHKPYIIRPLGQLDPFLFKRHRFRKYLYMYTFEYNNLNRASLIHFTTEGERQLALSLGIKSPSFVLPIGIDLKKFTCLPDFGTFRSNYQKLKDKKIILFLSRINFKKGLDILVEAFAKLAKKHTDAHLVIAGPDNDGYEKKVKKWLKSKGVLDRTTFTGMLLGKDKLAAFRDSDIFVLPSYSENFGLAVVEAMACGLPVVISNRVNISSDIIEARAGIVIDPSPAQLYNAIQRLFDEPQLLTEMGKRGQALVKEKFVWDIIVSRMIKVYQSILEKSLKIKFDIF